MIGVSYRKAASYTGSPVACCSAPLSWSRSFSWSCFRSPPTSSLFSSTPSDFCSSTSDVCSLGGCFTGDATGITFGGLGFLTACTSLRVGSYMWMFLFPRKAKLICRRMSGVMSFGRRGRFWVMYLLRGPAATSFDASSSSLVAAFFFFFFFFPPSLRAASSLAFFFFSFFLRRRSSSIFFRSSCNAACFSLSVVSPVRACSSAFSSCSPSLFAL
mmetsp:Transcript_15218/g.25267  ORF Transcript_15218/g.25267 Transcript_15218/m.25267 type:complete len:215 (-) Transcript_15218:1280-1924(-)